MPKPVIITADSTADLPPDIRAEFDIHFIPLHITVEGRTGLDCIEIFPEEIWEAFQARGSLPKTAAPSIAEFQAFFSGFTKTGADVVHITINAKFSACHQFAFLAAEEVNAAGEGQVYVVDSQNLSIGTGMLCMQGARLRDEGMEGGDIAERLHVLRDKVQAHCFLDGITFLAKSGRAPAVVAMGAALFNLHPALRMGGSSGEIVIGKKYRGKSATAAENWLHDTIRHLLETCDPSLCFFMHTPEMPPEQYEPMYRIVKKELAGAGRLIIGKVGCMVVSHLGGNCYALVGMEK